MKGAGGVTDLVWRLLLLLQQGSSSASRCVAETLEVL